MKDSLAELIEAARPLREPYLPASGQDALPLRGGERDVDV